MDLKKIAGRVAGSPVTVKARTDVDDFLDLLPEAGLEAIWDLLPEPETEYPDDADPDEDPEPLDTSTPPKDFEVPGVGKVTAWVGPCSEGADRGGYVRFFKLHGFVDEKGAPVVLEADEGAGELLFNNRMSVL